MKRNSTGFTLIEMAIVLVIVGLILGAVTKGRDMVESARQKNFYTSVVRGWQLAFVNYADRTGLLLADAASDTNARTAETTSRDGKINGSIENAVAQLQAVGLEPPTLSPYVFYDSKTITMSLNSSRGKNWLRFHNIPARLAFALDTIIDGEMDPDNGAVTYTVSEDNVITKFVFDIGIL